MKKLLFLLSVLLLVGMIAPARTDVTPSQIVKEYKVGDKTYCLVKRSDFYRLTRPEMNAAWEKFWESGIFLNMSPTPAGHCPSGMRRNFWITGYPAR